MASKRVKRVSVAFMEPVVRQNEIACLLRKLSAGQRVSDAHMQSVLLPEEFKTYQMTMYTAQQVREQRKSNAQSEWPDWIKAYSRLIRNGNLVYPRNNNRGETLFERAGELLEENYREGSTELLFDRPVRSLFMWDVNKSDYTDNYGYGVGWAPGCMPLPVKNVFPAPPSFKSIKQNALREAYDAIENHKLPAVRDALLKQKDED